MGLSITHIVILLVIVLIIFGPSRLPGLGKSLGEAIRGFKKGINEDEIDVTDSSARREQMKHGEAQDTSSAKAEEKEKV